MFVLAPPYLGFKRLAMSRQALHCSQRNRAARVVDWDQHLHFPLAMSSMPFLWFGIGIYISTMLLRRKKSTERGREGEN